jgi:hypothetical protein
MPQTCVAIPVGGKVNVAYLRETFETLRQSEVVVYVGLDEAESLSGVGNYDEVRALCAQHADKVMLFPREYYYRPGGIWKKILDCWQDSGCAFLRGIGYDDLLPPAGIRQQQAMLQDNPALAACYANQVIQYDDDVAGRTLQNTCLSPLKRLRAIGQNPFSFICWTVRREAILTPEFYAKTLKGSAAWEWLFHATLLGAGGKHCNTAFADTPIRREHHQTISSQYTQMTPEQKKLFYDQIFAITRHSTDMAIKDWQSLNMPSYYLEQRQRLSPLLGRLVSLLPQRYYLEN